MESILNLTKTNKLILAAIAFLAVVGLGSGQAHAATLTVSGGCAIDEAVIAVNDAVDGNGCVKTGAAYGSSDTINIPSGSHMAIDVPEIENPVTIKGAGMDQTTVDADGLYEGFESREATMVTISDMKITNFIDSAIEIGQSSAVLKNLDIDGAGADANGILVFANDGGTYSLDAENVYVHNIQSTNGYVVAAFLITSDGQTNLNIDLRSTTIADIHNTVGGAIGVYLVAGTDNEGGSNLTADVVNTTVHNITSPGFSAPFGSLAGADNGITNVNTNITNITITGMRGGAGSIPFPGLISAAYYAIGFTIEASDVANVTTTVSNSIMADNLNDGVSSNCAVADASATFGGTGTVNAAIVSGGHNISDDDSCAGFNQPGDLQNFDNIIPTLGPLQDNGGVVPTRALLAGSPAIASGASVLGVTTDARGVVRNAECPSVGAFQFEGAVCAASTTNGGGTNAGAPNTGIGAVSPAMTIIATSLGLGIIAYALRKRTAVK